MVWTNSHPRAFHNTLYRRHFVIFSLGLRKDYLNEAVRLRNETIGYKVSVIQPQGILGLIEAEILNLEIYTFLAKLIIS